MILSLALSFALAQGYFTPEEAQALFSQANEAYAREDFAAAEQGYLKLVERGSGGADVLFNLGTVYLAQNKLGQAVLYLERARLEGGRAEDIEANLAVARAKQIDQVVGGQMSDSFLRRLTLATPAGGVAWLFLACWCLAFAALLAQRLLAGPARAAAGAAAVLGLVLAVPSGALLAGHVYVRETLDEAVVLAPTLAARELPRDTARISFEVHAGLKVRLLEASGPFVKIRLPNGLEGWTQREGVAEI